MKLCIPSLFTDVEIPNPEESISLLTTSLGLSTERSLLQRYELDRTPTEHVCYVIADPMQPVIMMKQAFGFTSGRCLD